MNKDTEHKYRLADCGCGGKVELFQDACNYIVGCNKCGIETPMCETPEKAVDIWNTAFGGRNWRYLEWYLSSRPVINAEEKDGVICCKNCGTPLTEKE